MASFTPNQFLTADPVVQLRCQQHAARTFVDDSFRLLPKNKFLFHVAFNINWAAISATNLNAKLLKTLKSEINILVKTADLPSYTVNSVTLNQYNRKKVVQFQHKYNDVSIKFNDDNMGLINQLWQAYYTYYYQDPKSSATTSAYTRNATKKSSFITSPYGYSGPSKQFFNYITIYQMARHEFVSYKLINPIISSWTGNKLDYSGKESHDFDMKLQYEAVYYDTGVVADGTMEGFADTHYDWTPSPLAKTPGTTSTTASPSFAKTSFGGSSTNSSMANSSTQQPQGTTLTDTTSVAKGSLTASAVTLNTKGASATDVTTQTSTAGFASAL